MASHILTSVPHITHTPNQGTPALRGYCSPLQKHKKNTSVPGRKNMSAAVAADPPNESTRHEGADDVHVVEGGGKGVTVIKPALVFKTGGGDVFDVPAATAKAINDFEVLRGYKREGTRKRSFMYSLGVYVEPVEKAGQEYKHKYSCMADAMCRRNKHISPCKDGDRSNVNTHHRLKHKLCERDGKGRIEDGSKQARCWS